MLELAVEAASKDLKLEKVRLQDARERIPHNRTSYRRYFKLLKLVALTMITTRPTCKVPQFLLVQHVQVPCSSTPRSTKVASDSGVNLKLPSAQDIQKIERYILVHHELGELSRVVS